MSLVELQTYHDRFEAEIVRGRLQAEGFDVLLFDGGLSAVHGGALPVRLMVLREDRHAALTLLANPPDAPD